MIAPMHRKTFERHGRFWMPIAAIGPFDFRANRGGRRPRLGKSVAVRLIGGMRYGDRHGQSQCAANQTSHKFVKDHGDLALRWCARRLSPTPMKRSDLDQNGACDLVFPQIGSDSAQSRRSQPDLARLINPVAPSLSGMNQNGPSPALPQGDSPPNGSDRVSGRPISNKKHPHPAQFAGHGLKQK